MPVAPTGAGQYTANLVNANDALTFGLPDSRCSKVVIQLTGTWTGTVTYEVTLDGTTWVAILGTPTTTATQASTSTANQALQFETSGYFQFRARFSTASSGTVVANGRSVGY